MSKCLSVLQPWASLIVHGMKRYETRGWRIRHRGPLLIHASSAFGKEAIALCRKEPFKTALCLAGYEDPEMLPLGGVIGSVCVEECVEGVLLENLNDVERAFGNFGPGRWAFKLTDPQPLPLIPCRGRLHVYEVDVEALCVQV